MDRAIARWLAPDIVLHPGPVLDAPDARVAETVADPVERGLVHADIGQPPFQVAAGLHVIVAADHRHGVRARHFAGPHVLAGMVGRPPVAELDELQVVVDAVLMHVVEIGYPAIGALEFLLGRAPSVQIRGDAGVPVAVPRDIVAEIDAADADLVDLVVRGVLRPEPILGAQALLRVGPPELPQAFSGDVVPVWPAQAMLPSRI